MNIQYMYEKSRPNLFNKMNNIVFKEEQIQKNQTFPNKTEKIQIIFLKK